MDLYTKWAKAFPLRSKEAEAVGRGQGISRASVHLLRNALIDFE